MRLLRILFYYFKLYSSGYAQQYIGNEYKNPDSLKEYQLVKLQKLLEYCWGEVPFYQKFWRSHGITSPQINDVSEICRFPIVTKKDLREGQRLGLFRNPQSYKEKFTWQQTTGSTGEPFKFPQEKSLFRRKRVVSVRAQQWYGYKAGDIYVKLWRSDLRPGLKTKITEFLSGQYTISIYDPSNPVKSSLSEQRIQDILNQIREVQPQFLDGFVSALIVMARYIQKTSFKVDWNFKAVITAAEKLTIVDRELIERAFGVPVFDRYGGTESSLIAHECATQSRSNHWLHVQEDRLFVEVVDANDNPISDGVGDIVFTDLDSYLFPFVRYKNGDMAKVDSASFCECGIKFKCFVEVLGRTNQNFILKDGSLISSHLWQNLFKKCPTILSYQMIQSSRDLITVNYILNEIGGDQIPEFMTLVKKVEGALPGIEVIWRQVDEIPRSVGGKFNQHICLVSV